jgi:glycosyltransferase involved in cell wall biosynthesis
VRVALLHPTYWPEVRRGSERFVHDVGGALAARGHRVRLITSHAGPPRRSIEDGLEVQRVWRPPDGQLRRRGHQARLTHVPFSYAALVRGDDDVAHALYPTDGLAAVRWSARTRRPAVLSIMGLVDRASLAGTRRRAETVRHVAFASAAVVTLSRVAADALWRELGIESRVVHPGVDLDGFAVAPDPVAARAGAPTILCPGDLRDPRKRAPLLLEAFARVRRERPDARLLLSAPGPARSGGLPEGVEVADVDAAARLVAAYRTAWVTVLPSVNEAFGLVLAESLACGTPVVGSAGGGAAEIVAPGVGELFAGEDPGTLAGVLLEGLELAAAPGIAEACRARAQAFSLSRCVDAHEALYREVSERRF